MQRVLHVIGAMNRAGAETMLMNIYRNIDRNILQFDFVCFTSSEGDYDKEINSLGGIIYRVVESGPIKRMWSLKKLLSDHPEYKIIHCHTLLSNSFHILAATMAGVKVRIVHSHNTRDESKSRFIGYLYEIFSTFIIQRYATHFIACGDAAAVFLFPRKKNYFLLPNSIDLSDFLRIGERHKGYLKAEYMLPDDCLVILQLGRLEIVKNHLFSIEIARELKRRGIAFKMFFVGKGELQHVLADNISESGLSNDIIMTGVRSDIAQIMSGADLMLMPSHFEGFPVVLVESQAIGLPALVSENVSREVDLGVDLITFLPLEGSLDIWVNAILNLKNNLLLSPLERMNILSSKGFDTKSTAKELTNYYSQISQ